MKPEDRKEKLITEFKNRKRNNKPKSASEFGVTINNLSVEEYFNNLSNEEFYSLLEGVGFKVTEGSGKIIFTEEKVFEGVVVEHYDDSGDGYYVVQGKTQIDEFGADELDLVLSEFKDKKVRVTIEVVE